jgi:NTE family protein
MATSPTRRGSRTTRKGFGIHGRWHYLPDLHAPSSVPVPERDIPVPAHRTPVLDATGYSSNEVIGFVLQGGGSLTAAQVGMLRALTEAGIRPDLVVGSSAGAINAVAYAGDPTISGLARLEAMWMGLHRRHVAPMSLRTLLAAVTGRGDGLFPDTGLRRQLEAHLPVHDLSEAMIPVHVVATDLVSGSAVVLSSGDAVTALLASSAFPGLYPPVSLGGRHLVDGGVAADVPILQAETLGASVIYILPAAGDLPAHTYGRGPLPLAYGALGQVLDGIARRDIAAARVRVLILPTITSRASNPVDFRDTVQQIAGGYERTITWLREQTPTAAAE